MFYRVFRSFYQITLDETRLLIYHYHKITNIQTEGKICHLIKDLPTYNQISLTGYLANDMLRTQRVTYLTRIKYQIIHIKTNQPWQH